MPKEDWFFNDDNFDERMDALIKKAIMDSFNIDSTDICEVYRDSLFDTIKGVFEGEGEVAIDRLDVIARLSENDFDDDIIKRVPLHKALIDSVRNTVCADKLQLIGELKSVISEIEKDLPACDNGDCHLVYGDNELNCHELLKAERDSYDT